jgi:hypothetical protein
LEALAGAPAGEILPEIERAAAEVVEATQAVSPEPHMRDAEVREPTPDATSIMESVAAEPVKAAEAPESSQGEVWIDESVPAEPTATEAVVATETVPPPEPQIHEAESPEPAVEATSVTRVTPEDPPASPTKTEIVEPEFRRVAAGGE